MKTEHFDTKLLNKTEENKKNFNYKTFNISQNPDEKEEVEFFESISNYYITLIDKSSFQY
jgi:hypothetical protein